MLRPGLRKTTMGLQMEIPPALFIVAPHRGIWRQEISYFLLRNIVGTDWKCEVLLVEFVHRMANTCDLQLLFHWKEFCLRIIISIMNNVENLWMGTIARVS